MTGKRPMDIIHDLDGGPASRAAIIPALRQFLYDLRDRLPMFAVYDHPADFPDHYIARLWLSHPEAAVAFVARSRDLDTLRDFLDHAGLVHLDPVGQDDPCILETWL